MDEETHPVTNDMPTPIGQDREHATPDEALRGAAPSPKRRFERWPYIERRRGDDRRGRPTQVWRSLLGGGDRVEGRREGEDANIYVDVYGRREVVLILVILALNILDAYFTLDYLEKGGREANPVAQGLLDLGSTWFIYAKSIFVGLCLVFLLIHKKFNYVDLALGFLTVFYSALLVYHLFLQYRFHLLHG